MVNPPKSSYVFGQLDFTWIPRRQRPPLWNCVGRKLEYRIIERQVQVESNARTRRVQVVESMRRFKLGSSFRRPQPDGDCSSAVTANSPRCSAVRAQQTRVQVESNVIPFHHQNFETGHAFKPGSFSCLHRLHLGRSATRARRGLRTRER